MTTASRSKSGRRPAKPPLPMSQELLDAVTTPDVVTVPPRTVLALAGQGAPEGEAFQHSVGAIYGIAYTLKFARKDRRRAEFKIGPLEARWWTDDPHHRLPDVPRDSWRWELRIAMPDDMKPAELTHAIHAATHKKGGKLEGNREVARLAIEQLPAARYGRVLHVGPYATEGLSFERIVETIVHEGYAARNAHLEVYLSDPRRASPDKLKTVLLLEIS